MLIASWPLHEFAGFLQIISWITLPVLFIAVLSTMLLHHYQRKRRKSSEAGLFPELSYQDEFVPLVSPDKKSQPFQQAHYRALKKDFDRLLEKYRESEGELGSLGAEMKRQDHVIDQLRTDVVSLEKNISNLRLALALKEEQISSMKQVLEEGSKPAMIAAEIS